MGFIAGFITDRGIQHIPNGNRKSESERARVQGSSALSAMDPGGSRQNDGNARQNKSMWSSPSAIKRPTAVPLHSVHRRTRDRPVLIIPETQPQAPSSLIIISDKSAL